MKVLQNYYGYNSFKGIKKETGASNVQENKSDMNYFVNKTFEVLAQRVEKEVPENGKYRHATGYEAAVTEWVDAFEHGSYDKFKLDDNGVPVMPDYSKL